MSRTNLYRLQSQWDSAADRRQLRRMRAIVRRPRLTANTLICAMAVILLVLSFAAVPHV